MHLAGNLGTVALVAVAGDKIIGWWLQRRPEREEQPSRRSQRAREIVQRWGVPGLALLAPLTTGTHIATVAAPVWSAVAAGAAVSGLDAFT
jgi:hypothetical protein